MSKKHKLKHTKACAYQRSNNDLWTLCDCRAHFNGKAFVHWQKMAQENVIDHLLRAPWMFDDRPLEQSIVTALCRDHLWQLAHSESPKMVAEVAAQRDRCIEGMRAVLRDICNSDNEIVRAAAESVKLSTVRGI
jgi:hypothetical protein